MGLGTSLHRLQQLVVRPRRRGLLQCFRQTLKYGIRLRSTWQRTYIMNQSFYTCTSLFQSCTFCSIILYIPYCICTNQSYLNSATPIYRGAPQPGGFRKNTGPIPSHPPPQGYICYRCGEKGMLFRDLGENTIIAKRGNQDIGFKGAQQMQTLHSMDDHV